MMKNRATNRLGKHHFAAEGVENMGIVISLIFKQILA